MTCPRHGSIVTNREHGQVFCLRCWAEANRHAEERDIEIRVTLLRASSSAIAKRLGWL